jgi:hypothetical protein
VKFAVVAPEATVTLARTVAAEVFELDSVTIAPPAEAAPLSVTVPVTSWPPGTEVWPSVTVESPGLTASEAVFAAP